MLKFTKPLQFVSALGIIITGVTLYDPSITRAENCDCTCEVWTATCTTACKSAGQTDTTQCDPACRKKYGNDYAFPDKPGNSYCNPRDCKPYSGDSKQKKKPSKTSTK